MALIFNTLSLKQQFKSVPESKDHSRQNAKLSVKHDIYFFIRRYRLHVSD